MSKISKFVKSPKLFFVDMMRNKGLLEKSIQEKETPKKATPKKEASKKATPKKEASKKATPKKEASKKATSKKEIPKSVVTNKVVTKKQPKTLLVHNVNFVEPIKFILHTGEKQGALAHLNIWIPYFEESNILYIILTRHIEAYEDVVSKYPDLKIIFAKSKKDTDSIMERLPTVKASFYPSNTGNNLHLLFYTQMKHIFIGHGDSDKTASAHKFFRVYDENWVAGEAHIDRFKNAGFDSQSLKHVKVGRPNLYEVIEKSQTPWRERFKDSFKLLYLPTWEGTYKEQDYSSLENIKESVILFKDIANLTVSLKLHPFSGNREKKFLTLEEDLKESKLCHIIEKKETVNHTIAKANIFICDISAVVSECLAGNGPIFLYLPKEKEIKISQSNMPYEEYCYVFSDTESLIEQLENVLYGDDYLEKNRAKAMEYILNKQDTLNSKFQHQLKELIGA